MIMSLLLWQPKHVRIFCSTFRGLRFLLSRFHCSYPGDNEKLQFLVSVMLMLWWWWWWPLLTTISIRRVDGTLETLFGPFQGEGVKSQKLICFCIRLGSQREFRVHGCWLLHVCGMFSAFVAQTAEVFFGLVYRGLVVENLPAEDNGCDLEYLWQKAWQIWILLC